MTRSKQSSTTPPGSASRWYVSTTIPYVNAKPHIGMALEYVVTDALARYHRRVGEDVYFLTGTDENALKNVQTAEREGVPVAELVERNSARFRELAETLETSFDDFIRTSADPRHIPGVHKLWEACARNGDIYRRTYRGLYCVGCELFYREDELIDGLCPIHLIPAEEVEEENYFFRLSRYGDQLEQLIASDTLRVIPETRKNEVLSFIRRGLEDFSVSRSRERAHGWGIPVPGDPSQVMYVWYDALGNYITALGYAHDGLLYQRYWQENPHRMHVLGKDVIRFHAVYWPAMLLSAGVPLPKTLLVHGWITAGGQKMSKSLGNVVDPAQLVADYGVESVRYFLLREISPFADSDFTLERFQRACNTDLADQLGNLLNRTISMIQRYTDGVVPASGSLATVEQALVERAAALPGRVDEAVRACTSNEALAAIWELVGEANRYVAETEPWALAKQRRAGDREAAQRLNTVLYTLAETLRLVASLLVPFLPETAAKIAAQVGVPLDESVPWATVTTWGRLAAGTRVQPGPILFRKWELP
ncbi:MAG TPA: class I tRNA ligase family protein, partial [Ktedonobacterales bacterium]